MAHSRFNTPESFRAAQEAVWGNVPGIIAVRSSVGDDVRRALAKRFGASLDDAPERDRLWSAARAVLGCEPGETGEIAPSRRGFWLNKEAFVAAVEQFLEKSRPAESAAP